MSTPPTDPSGDDELLARIARGDAAAFTALFRRRQAEVFRFALHMIGSPAAAEDVTQDVFLALMRDAGRYEPGRSSASAWLCGITRNHALRRLERDRATVPLEEDAVPESPRLAVHPDPLGDLTRSEEVDALRRAVLTLPVRYREVVVMCDLQELSYLDAARAVGCAVGTIRSRLHRGRALLAVKMHAYGRVRREPRTAGAEAAAPAGQPEADDADGQPRVAVMGKAGARCFV
jgi:RNA polymerase sigma-70 factor, ECF subfamily